MPLTKIAIFWKRNIWNSVSWRPATLCLVAGRGCPFGTFVLLKRETFSKKPWKKPLLAWGASISCFLNSKIRMVSSLTILLSRHTSRKSHQYPCSPLLPNIHPFFQRKITFFLFPCQFDICSFFPPNHASCVFYVQLLPQDSASLLVKGKLRTQCLWRGPALPHTHPPAMCSPLALGWAVSLLEQLWFALKTE